MKWLTNLLKEILSLRFARLTVLRRLTLRVATPRFSVVDRFLLHQSLPTVVSPAFCELVLEIDGFPSHFESTPSELWGDWGSTDKILKNRFANREDFKMTIRVDKIYDNKRFQGYVKKGFPLLARKGCIHFEALRH